MSRVSDDEQDLFGAIYDELKRIAAWHLSGTHNAITLDATDLTHQAIGRVLSQAKAKPANQTHALAIASMMVRRVLVNHLRDRNTLRRGSGRRGVSLQGRDIADRSTSTIDLLALHDSLDRLNCRNPTQARIVEMKYFGDLNTGDIAKYLGVSERQVRANWNHARLWLARDLSSEE